METTPIGKSAKKTTVLVADDAKFMRVKLRNILESNNFEIVGEAEDGKRAIELAGELNPDVVTMDITMPEMDGITALKEIKKKYPAIKVIMISAIGQKPKVADSLISGALDFIIKPFVPEKVIETMMKIANK